VRSASWLALLAALALVGCGSEAGVPPSAIAVVGGRQISRAAFAAQIDQARRSYEAAGRPFPAPGTPTYEHLKAITLRLLVERAELDIEADRLGIAITPAQIDARVVRFKQSAFGGSEQLYRRRLRERRTTDAEVRAGIRDELLAVALRKAGAEVPKPMKVRYARGFAPWDGG
jgi:SurA-like N-terminal domain